MTKNPFPFGTVASETDFVGREAEVQQVQQLFAQGEHVAVVAPQRFGKTSLLARVATACERPLVTVNLQMVTSVNDLAAHLLSQLFKCYPFERVKHLMAHFRFMPVISLNPRTNGMDVTLQATANASEALADVLQLIENVGTEIGRPIIAINEFQEILHLDKNLAVWLHGTLCTHHHVSYAFLGSQEATMHDLFGKKSGAFFRFAKLLPLKPIPQADFAAYLAQKFSAFPQANATRIAAQIVRCTDSHPHFTQMLAFETWNLLCQDKPSADVLSRATDEIVRVHDHDYERIWGTFNLTDKRLMILLCQAEPAPLSALNVPTSTAFSSLKRLMQHGHVIKKEIYEIGDPFFAEWIRLNS